MPEKNSFQMVLQNVAKGMVGGVAKRVAEEGFGFLGVVLNDCPREDKEPVMNALKGSLQGIPFTGGNRFVVKTRDLSGAFEYEDLERWKAYRESYPNAVFLIYDPHNYLDGKCRTYSIDFGACLDGFSCEKLKGGKNV